MSEGFIQKISDQFMEQAHIKKELYRQYSVKRGLRNADGTGVLAGLTQISQVIGFQVKDEDIIPVDGELYYRGININELVDGFEKQDRFGFSETTYLLLFGKLPNTDELNEYVKYTQSEIELPDNFTENSILQFPSHNIMNKMARSILVLYSLDDKADDISIPNVIRQSISLIRKVSPIVAYAYQAMRHKYHHESLFVHSPKSELSCAENFLSMLRQDGKFTKLEAKLLDLALVLHAEHGGGNNSTFTAHVVSSSHTDTYSAMAAAIGSLKGPLHGAANSSVMNMMVDIKENVKDWSDEDELKNYLLRMLRKEVFDKQGLIYGMGHAVYTISDPRAVILKQRAKELAEEKGRLDEYELYLAIEKLGPGLFNEIKHSDKVIAPNVDFYSGFVYDLLGFPQEIYTPIFAMARIVGWSAHRIEELINGGRIIRPAYKYVGTKNKYLAIENR